MDNIQIDNRGKVIMKIIKGLIFSFLITLASIFIFSLILTYTNVTEEIVPIVIIIITFISIMIGTIISVRKINKNGMLNGTIIGGGYVIFLYLISSILNTGFTFNVYSIIMIVCGIVSGIIGGIIGVNT